MIFRYDSYFAKLPLDKICGAISDSITNHYPNVIVKSVKHKMLKYSLQVFIICKAKKEINLNGLSGIVTNDLISKELLPNKCGVSYSSVHNEKFVQRVNFDIEMYE